MPRFIKKPGPGRFYVRSGRGITLIRPGEIVEKDEAFYERNNDQFNRLDPEPPPPEQIAVMRAVKRNDGYYDVINDVTNEPINDDPLTKEEAESLIGADIDDADIYVELLKGVGCETLEDVIALSDDDLRAIPGIGESGILYIRRACGKLQLGRLISAVDQSCENEDNDPETEDDILIAELSDIPPNIQAVLRKVGILTVGDTGMLSDQQLLAIRGIGESSLAIIRKACADAIVAAGPDKGNEATA